MNIKIQDFHLQQLYVHMTEFNMNLDKQMPSLSPCGRVVLTRLAARKLKLANK